MIYLRGWGLGRKRERGREGGSSTVFVIALEKKKSLFCHCFCISIIWRTKESGPGTTKLREMFSVADI